MPKILSKIAEGSRAGAAAGMQEISKGRVPTGGLVGSIFKGAVGSVFNTNKSQESTSVVTAEHLTPLIQYFANISHNVQSIAYHIGAQVAVVKDMKSDSIRAADAAMRAKEEAETERTKAEQAGVEEARPEPEVTREGARVPTRRAPGRKESLKKQLIKETLITLAPLAVSAVALFAGSVVKKIDEARKTQLKEAAPEEKPAPAEPAPPAEVALPAAPPPPPEPPVVPEIKPSAAPPPAPPPVVAAPPTVEPAPAAIPAPAPVAIPTPVAVPVPAPPPPPAPAPAAAPAAAPPAVAAPPVAPPAPPVAKKVEVAPSDAKPKRISASEGKKAMIQAMDNDKITDPTQRAAIMAQVGHESGGFTTLSENLAYRASTLMTLFRKYFSRGDAEEVAKKGPVAIADRIYGGRMGNAPEGSGEGFKFRGRGFVQLTGKSNYQKFGVAGNPDQVAEISTAADTAIKYMKQFKGNWADVKSVTKFVNGGYIGLEDRAKHFEAYLKDPSITQAGTATAAPSTPSPSSGATIASLTQQKASEEERGRGGKTVIVNNSKTFNNNIKANPTIVAGSPDAKPAFT